MYRSYLVKILPNLKEIDGEKLRRVKVFSSYSVVLGIYHSVLIEGGGIFCCPSTP